MSYAAGSYIIKNLRIWELCHPVGIAMQIDMILGISGIYRMIAFILAVDDSVKSYREIILIMPNKPAKLTWDFPGITLV